MNINKKLEGNNLTICLEGRLDANAAPELEKEIENIENIENIVLDLSELEYISSAGLRIILILQKTMNSQGSLIIKNANDEVKRVFEVTGFLDILTIE